MVNSILIIDDEKVFLTSIAAYLRDKGFEVFKATSGEEGVRIAEEVIPDIIITDWDLPNITGIDLVKKLQQQQFTKDIPIIVSSGVLISVKDMEQAFQAGAIDFMRKPVEKVELLARINSALRLSESYKQLKEEKSQLEFANSELKRLQNKLIHHEKMNSLNQLTSGVAHEINNPLNFVLGGAEAINLIISDLRGILHNLNDLKVDSELELPLKVKKIQEELKESNTFEDLSLLATDVSHGGKRIMQIVHGLSAFAQIKNTGAVIGDIHEGINATLMLLTNQFQDRIEVKKNFDPKIPHFKADHGSLNQVFLNILTNGIQAIPNKGTLSITTMRKESNIDICIEDTGKGMPQHMVEKIFIPYFTADDAQKGYGIGLSVSYNIIKEHNGELKCISQENEGTTFIISLPYLTVND